MKWESSGLLGNGSRDYLGCGGTAQNWAAEGHDHFHAQKKMPRALPKVYACAKKKTKTRKVSPEGNLSCRCATNRSSAKAGANRSEHIMEKLF